jgi:CYTH domain-containing protein
MPVEIERKFLVKHDGWKSHCVRSVRIRDGLLASSDGCKVRVRISERKATLAVKSAQVGVTRSEFEYEVPLADAEEMLRLCGDRHLEKIRYFVPHAGATWEINAYEGILSGVVIAEIELQTENQSFELPDWIDKDVTHDPKYQKFNLVAQRDFILSEQSKRLAHRE